MKDQIITDVLFTGILISGLYAGMGFFHAMGLNPAMKKMSNRTFVEFWQCTDHYMAKRMSKFGPLLLLSFIADVMVLLYKWQTIYFWLVVMSLIFTITDIVFVIRVNHPLNRLAQSWNLNNLPAGVEQIKKEVVKAFNRRLLLMIGAFILLLLAVWLRSNTR